jgi:hypothetical protein
MAASPSDTTGVALSSWGVRLINVPVAMTSSAAALDCAVAGVEIAKLPTKIASEEAPARKTLFIISLII